MTLGALVAVPAAPLVLPSAVPHPPSSAAAAIAALRDDVRGAVAALAGADAALLLAGGLEPLVHDARHATLASYGLPGVTTAIATHPELLAAVAGRGQASRVRSDRLDGDLAVLALLLDGAGVHVPVVPVTVPVSADATTLRGIAAGLAGAAAAVDGSVAVVAAADLAATLHAASPGYVVDGAAGWDCEVHDAVRDGDPAALQALGPDAAARFVARGWAPLTVLCTLVASAGRRPEAVAYHAPRGVGGLVATAPAGG